MFPWTSAKCLVCVCEIEGERDGCHIILSSYLLQISEETPVTVCQGYSYIPRVHAQHPDWWLLHLSVICDEALVGFMWETWHTVTEQNCLTCVHHVLQSATQSKLAYRDLGQVSPAHTHPAHCTKRVRVHTLLWLKQHFPCRQTNTHRGKK